MINAPLDFYDDPSGSILKNKVPSPDHLPDFVKTAERLTPSELEKLPDDVFALVAVDDGRKMRKYACVDQGNTLLSVLYFMENHDRLPEEAQKTAAANLITACDWYGMTPPEQLEKIAMGIRARSGGGRSRALFAMRAARRMARGEGTGQALTGAARTGVMQKMVFSSSGQEAHGAETEKTALVGAAMGALTMGTGVAQGHKDWKKRKQALRAGVPGSQVMKIKASELSGTGPMPQGKDPDPEKTSALRPHVDITGKEAPVKIEHEEGQRFCLVKEGEARYPIDTASQVERAANYFMEHRENFSPFERHQYCVKLAARADELGLEVHDDIKKYGSSTLAPDAHVAIYTRQRMFREGSSAHSLLEEMREKCASVKPGVLAVTLEDFDRKTNLDLMWDREIPDPYFSVFGIEKQAEWSYKDGTDYISESQLKLGVKRSYSTIKEMFGEDMAKELSEKPIQIFDSLPLDTKRIIMRLANDPHPQDP